MRAHPEIENALSRINAQLAAAPADADLYVARGELYSRHEEWLMAEANYQLARELAPLHPRLPFLQGVVELASGRAADALAHFNFALTLDPRNADALVFRGRARVTLGDSQTAVTDFDAALGLIASPPPELFLERARLLAPAEAIRSLDDGIARLGPAFTLHLRALELEEQLGRIDAANARLDRIIAGSERREAWLMRRGDILARAGRVQEARAAYDAALAAISALPDWLRDSPDAKRLAAEIAQRSAPRS